MRLRQVLVVVGVVAISSTAPAQTRGPRGVPTHLASAATRIDPRFHAIEQALRTVGPRSPYFGGRGLPDGTRPAGVGALLRFDRPLASGEVRALEAAGVDWQRHDGELVRVGNVYGAFVTFAALPALAALPHLVLAEVAWHPVIVQPLEETTAEIGATSVRQMPQVDSAGAGAVIGDVDSGVDVLHPHLFRADGGAYPWIDVDGDGRPSARIDAVDYNRDGVADPNELMVVLDATELSSDGEVSNADERLDVTRDWVYVDANGDGERNVGPADGFTEFDPGYGEPVFVPDDANRDGVLEPEERFLLLGSSKVQRFVTTAHTYERGVDLIDSANVPFADEFFHGTGVSSILVGGQPPHRRVGVAPDADLVMYAAHMDAPGGGFEESGQLLGIQQAVQSGIDVLVHEWTDPTTAPLDGSGNLEEAMLNARAAGVVQVNPLGNLNLSQKHIEVDVAAGVSEQLGFAVGPGFDSSGTNHVYSTVYASLYWRSDQEPTFTLRGPTGDTLVLPTDGSIGSIGADNVQATTSESLRGTHQLLLVLWSDDVDTTIAMGDWSLEVDAPAGDHFIGRITDYWSGWSVGVRWLNPTQDHGTVVYPATADAAYGVAAYGGRNAMPSDGTDAGELRNFSGRGPRIDGAPVVDIAAPDDPYVAWGVSAAWLETGVGRSWFTTFGGTSGAGPHVVGTVALIRGLEPDATPAEIEQRITSTARTDGFTGPAPVADAWGPGKLDAFAAVMGMGVPENEDPTVVLEMVDPDRVSAAASTDPDGDDLSFRWDLDYDGTWDSDWVGDPTATPAPGAGVVRVEVRDGRGGVGGAALRLSQPEQMDDPVDLGDDPAPDDEITVNPLAPPPTSCGCSSARPAGSAGDWVLALLLVGVPLRRRRN